MGDVVCMLNRDTNQRDESFSIYNWTGNQWFPFTVPWSVCHILPIYADQGEDGSGDDDERIMDDNVGNDGKHLNAGEVNLKDDQQMKLEV